MFGALVGRDFGAVEGFYAPDAIYRGAQVGTFEGAAAIRGLFEDMLSPYEEFHGQVEEVVDLGNESSLQWSARTAVLLAAALLPTSVLRAQPYGPTA